MKRKNLIYPNNVNGRYKCRLVYYRSELLTCLPKEMLAAQEQIPNNSHCNGEFWVSSGGRLMCTMHYPNDNERYYEWNTINWEECK